MSEVECQKLSNELQQSIQDRQELEALAKKLTEQLETATNEKDNLLGEYTHNQVSKFKFSHLSGITVKKLTRIFTFLS